MPSHLGNGARDVDDDDNPQLVQQQDPPPLTHTFLLDLTPSLPPTLTDDSSPNHSASVTSSPPASPMTPVEFISEITPLPTQSRPHGKRRDPSYIPRPPNAFILFRSAFIRDQNIPGKVEGNHSKLSKIIGLCWKQLPREEREKWEARAVVAQAEHRTRYPDWRFRPGSNARIKASEPTTVATRRRSVRSRAKPSPSKDGEDDDSEYKLKNKGKAASKTSRMPTIEETRCVKIAGFVAEGLKGDDLEFAVRQWEDDRQITRPETRPKRAGTTKSLAASSRAKKNLSTSHPDSSPVGSHSDSFASDSTQHIRTPLDDNKSISSTENATTIPLTHMFKRRPSVSVPENPLSPLSAPHEQSLEDVNHPSTEASTTTWGTLSPEKASQRTHTDLRTREGSLPMPSTSSSTTFEAPHLAWQRENQTPIDAPHSWWHDRSTPVESPSDFNFDKEREADGSLVFVPETMGYEPQGTESQYSRSFMEHFRYEVPQENSQHIQWTNLAPMNGQGIGILVEDPYKDDCTGDSSRTLSEPPTLSIAPPPSSSGSFYYSSRRPPPSLPSSSYSALSGWAGDYKSLPATDIKSWPENTFAPTTPLSITTGSSSAWYNNQGMYNWNGTARSQLQHDPLSVGPDDWDRQEQRVASHMNLDDGSPRHPEFHDHN